MSALDETGLPRVARLSPRQVECLQGLADHLETREIADRLGIADRTVDNHVTAAIAVLGVRTRREAVRVFVASRGTGSKVHGAIPLIDGAAEARPSELAHRLRETAPASYQPEPARSHQGERHNAHQPQYLTTVAKIAGLAAAMAILALALPKLGEGAQQLANLIQPYHHTS